MEKLDIYEPLLATPEVQQGPEGGFRRRSIGLVFLELGKSKTTGARPVPRLLPGAQKSFDEWRR
jgi:hypothetical protein